MGDGSRAARRAPHGLDEPRYLQSPAATKPAQ
jgi:hypothetical protein